MCTKYFLIGILFIITWNWADAQSVSVKKLPFSNIYTSEIAPIVKDSVLYFSADKNVKWASKLVDQDSRNFYNLFTTTQNADSSWTEVQQYLPDYFSVFHTSTISFSPFGDGIYFTEVHNKDKVSNGRRGGDNFIGVYYGAVTDNGFRKAKSLSFNSERSFNTGHPTVSSDGRYLFYVSDIDGGFGKVDIYFSKRSNGEWGPANNLGDVVNTDGNELFPFYHSSGKLFFASDGHGGKGNLDLFYTMLSPDGWIEPVPLDSGINTKANEFSCFISDDEQCGYFASDKDGDDDIYEFKYLFPIFGPGTKQKENRFRYRFYDRMGGKSDGPLKYVWYFGDGEKAEGDTVIHKYKKPGSYHVQSVLVDTIENIELFVLNDFYQEVKPKIQVYITSADIVKVGDVLELNALKSNLGDLVPNGYYWEMPDGTKKKGEIIQYVFGKTGRYKVKCGTISIDDPKKRMCSYKEITVID